MKSHIFLGMVLMASTSVPRAQGVTRPADAAEKPPASTTRSARPALVYKLGKGAAAWDGKTRERIVKAMDDAVAIYNANGHFEKTVTASYNPATPTADANYNGSIRFGGQIGLRTALHEIAHTLGIGQHAKWNGLIKEGKWTGEHALAQLRAFDGDGAALHADRQHFWPYGLNQDREGGEENFKRHVKMVHAFRRDLGIVE